MKAVNLIFFILFSLAGICQDIENSDYGVFILDGYVNGRDTGKMILRYADIHGKLTRDTTYLSEGRFRFKGRLKEPTYAVLRGHENFIDFHDVNDVSLFLEPAVQQIALSENDYENARMQGSKSQAEYDTLIQMINAIKIKWARISDAFLVAKKEFLAETDSTLKDRKKEKADLLFEKLDTSRAEIRQVVITFVKHHPDSYVSAFMLATPIRNMSTDSAMKLYSLLTSKIKNSQYGKWIFETIHKKIELEVGSTAPSFKAKTFDDKDFSSTELRGRIMLLDFWASWCIPCREALPELKLLFNKYHPQGFEIVTISIDQDKDSWRNTIAEEKIEGWYNLLVNEDISKNYLNVHLPIPSDILINKNGKIIFNSTDKSNHTSLEQVLSSEFR